MVKPVEKNIFTRNASLAWGARLILVSIALFLLAACSGKPASTGILSGKVQKISFDEVKKSVDELYSHHPDINSYSIKNVYYNNETRDKVLTICNKGSALNSTQYELETQKVMACAPLIFFFYSYGEEKSVPEATQAAQKLYWYAMTDNPSLGDSPKAFTALLQGWGIK